jgi:hypothetical protein
VTTRGDNIVRITSNSTNGLLENNFINSIKTEATKRPGMQYYHFDNIDDLIFNNSSKHIKNENSPFV